MRIDETRFRAVLDDLLAEDPLACRGVFGISRISFTASVSTLAVSLQRPAMLEVNLDFVREHCRSEDDIKAVLLHEFMHVLFRHTDTFRSMTPLLNIALDSIINATIHRLAGARYSSFFARYYRDARGINQLLHTPDCMKPGSSSFHTLWRDIYAGRVLAGDVYDLLREVALKDLQARLPEGRFLLGNHEDGPPCDFMLELPPEIQKRLESLGRQHLGGGQAGRVTDLELERRKASRVASWEPVLRELIQRFACASPRARRTPVPSPDALLPILHPADRRSMLQSLWSPVFPQSRWPLVAPRPRPVINIYLDVSGSMNEHFPPLVDILIRHSSSLRHPFWAFSDTVEPACIRNGKLRTRTSGGTRMTAVLEHFLQSNAPRAVIITDGICERIAQTLASRLPRGSCAALLLPKGTTQFLAAAGVPCFKLPGE